MDSVAKGSGNWLNSPPSPSDRGNSKKIHTGGVEHADSTCSTPKKMPAKILNEHKIADDNNDEDDSYFIEFFERVKLAQQGSMPEPPKEAQSNTTKASRRQSPAPLSVLPDYARYQDHKLQRVLSRGNSYKELLTPRSPERASLCSPRVEWIPDRQSPRGTQRSWDEETLIARHAFPTSIFCKRSDCDQKNAASVQERSNYSWQNFSTSDLSDISLHGLSKSGSFREQCSCSPSIPSAATLSSASSSSGEEPKGIRQFLAFLERNPSFSNRSRHSFRSEGTSHTSMVEISPGVSEPLRRADETIHAVRNDFYVPVSCFSCSLDIFCIADAKYVVCPTCRVVSPIEEGALDGQKLVQHGLGLGFTCESLFEIQTDILSKRG